MLNQQGLEVCRHVRTLIRRMAIVTLYRKPNTSKPTPGHRIYPFLLRRLAITRPNQAWAMDITYIAMTRGFVYLAAVLDWFSHRLLAWRKRQTRYSYTVRQRHWRHNAQLEPAVESAENDRADFHISTASTTTH